MVSTITTFKNFDEVISVGALSSLQKPQELLTGMARKLKKNAQITFVDYDKFFYILK